MPPRGKRRTAAGTSNTTRANNKRAKDSARHRPTSSTTAYSDAACMEWFQSYVDPGKAEIGPSGTMRLCEDLNVTPENVLMLVIAWKAESATMGTFTAAEWHRCMSAFRCHDTASLLGKKEMLLALLQDFDTFKSIYRFAYQYTRSAMEHPGQKSIDKLSALMMLQVLLAPRWPMLPQFATFLKQHSTKVINRDQWMSILEFSCSIGNDFENYDPDSAWPVLLDDFVEWCQEDQS